jgi:hypothetical protein
VRRLVVRYNFPAVSGERTVIIFKVEYCYFLGLLFDPDDGSSMIVGKVGDLPDYTASHP